MKFKLITLAVSFAVASSVFAAKIENSNQKEKDTLLSKNIVSNNKKEIEKDTLLSKNIVSNNKKKINIIKKKDKKKHHKTLSVFTSQILGYNGTDNDLAILQSKKLNYTKDNNISIIFGGNFKSDFVWQKRDSLETHFCNPIFSTSKIMLNVENPSLQRIRLQLTDINFYTIANFNKWATAYIELDGRYNGPNTLIGEKIEFNQAYLLLGNLNKFPIYTFIGRKTVNFGRFTTFNIYSKPLNNIVFKKTATSLGIGYYDNGFNLVISGINDSSNKLKNYAINLQYNKEIGNILYSLGTGYRKLGEYKDTLSIITIPGQQDNYSLNAWDINSLIKYKNFNILGEYIATFDSRNIINATNIASWNIETAYNFPFINHNSKISIGYSVLKGYKDIYTKQYVVGIQSEIVKNIWTGLEFSHINNSFLCGRSGEYITQKPKGYQNTIVVDISATL